MGLDPEMLANAAAEALSGHRCVSGWLGYGNALFLGFGSQPIPARRIDGRRSSPPYELQTSIAIWRVIGNIVASCEDERGLAEEAIQALIGLSVAGWQLSDNSGLEIEFVDRWRLDIAPPAEIDPEGTSTWTFGGFALQAIASSVLVPAGKWSQAIPAVREARTPNLSLQRTGCAGR